MQPIIEQLRLKGWREDEQVILGPEGEVVVDWVSAAQMVIWAHYYHQSIAAKKRAVT